MTGRERVVSGFTYDTLQPTFPACADTQCPRDNGVICTQDGSDFRVSCDTAYGAQQLANLCFTTFAQCIAACATTYGAQGCTGVSYFSWMSSDCAVDPYRPWDNINCFPFAVAQNPSTGENANGGWSVTKVSSFGGVIAAVPDPPAPVIKDCSAVTCPADGGSTCKDGTAYFKVSCDTAYGAQQLANLCFNSFPECIHACAATYGAQGCTGVSYFSWTKCGTSPFPWDEDINCFPFKVAQNPSTGQNANGGWSVTKTTTAVAPVIPQCSTLDCPDAEGTVCLDNGRKFKISCDTTYGSAQLAGLCRSTLTDCLHECSTTYANQGCVGVNFFPEVAYCSNPLTTAISCVPYAAKGDGAMTGGWSALAVGDSGKKKRSLVPVPKPATGGALAALRRRAAGDDEPAVDETPVDDDTTPADETPVDDDTTPVDETPADDETPNGGQQGTGTTITNSTLPSNTTTNGTTSSNSSTVLPDEHRFGPVSITDLTGDLVVHPFVNGSLFISLATDTADLDTLTGGATFVADLDSGLVTGDSKDRLLYYFPETMAELGASRLRLGHFEKMPIGATLISLVPFAAEGNAHPVLAAVDSLMRNYFPMVCALQGQLNKVFLVESITGGSAILESQALMHTVVGGKAQNCTAIPFVGHGLEAVTVSEGNA